MISVSILGASGYAGGELIRLIDGHPAMEAVHLGAHSRRGARLAEVHPQLTNGERILGTLEPDEMPSVDLVFLALPHGASWQAAHTLAETGALVVDLGSDYRLDTDSRYRAAYGVPHPLPSQLSTWVYGLPELFALSGTTRVASPGCYPTAVLLAIVPLMRAGLIGPGPIVADCLSGVSGAGRTVREDLMFGSVAEGVRAYGVTTHRHRPEMEMAIELTTGLHAKVVFTPHLVPMQRGELATVTAPASGRAARSEVLDALRQAYDGAPFVEVIEDPPQTRWVAGSNRAFVTAFTDDHTGMIIAQTAIDNLLKGAAGQAVQSANIMTGLEQTTGLVHTGWMP